MLEPLPLPFTIDRPVTWKAPGRPLVQGRLIAWWGPATDGRFRLTVRQDAPPGHDGPLVLLAARWPAAPSDIEELRR